METTRTYVEILYPGILFSESDIREVRDRNPEKIKAGLPKGAFAFLFYDMASKRVKVDGEHQIVWGKKKNISGTYYPDGEVFTLEQVKKLKDHKMLLDNMKNNGWKKVVKARVGNFQPFKEKDQII